MADHATEEGAEPRTVSADERLRAEVDRFNAEIRKLNLEADQIEKEMVLPFFRRAGFVKAVIAGILALPVIWWYNEKIVIPYQNARSDLLSIRNEKAQEENASVTKELDELREDLGAKRQDLETRRQELSTVKGQLQNTSQDLAVQARERSKLESLRKMDKEESARMQADLARRNRDLDEAVSSLARIGEELARPTPSPPPAAPAPSAAPAAPVVSAATVILSTTDDDKDADAIVSIAINAASGAVFTWKEERSEQWKHRTQRKIALNRVGSLPLSLFENATIEICMSRKREHGWQFDYTGSLYVGDEAVLSFERRGNKIDHGRGVSCVGSPLR